jgi:chromosome segregation ATPase
MSRQYSTTDSEISDIGDDLQDLLQKNSKLIADVEALKKEICEKEHGLTQRIKELEIENEKLKGLVKNHEELAKNLKNPKPQSVIIPHGNKSGENSHVILELEQKLADFENQIFHLKQSEQELLRQNQTLKREISDLNLDIDKIKMNASKKETKNIYAKLNESCDMIDLDNMDEEKKLIFQELVKGFEDLKKENQELKENAITALTEKEMANIELREQIEEMKTKFNVERNNFIEEISKYKTRLNDIEIDKSYYEGDDISFTKEETKELIEKYNKLEEDFYALKAEMEEKEFNYETEKMKRENELERTLYTYKSNIFNLEQEISRYQQELSSFEMDRAQLEREKEQDYENKNILVTELEKFQSKIRLIEESREKAEQKYKDQLSFFSMQLSETDRQNTILKNNKIEAEKELIDFKLNFNNKIKEEKEKFKADLIAKDRELYTVKEKLDTIEKETVMLKQSSDLSKKNYEKLKSEYNVIHENMKKIKELHEIEIRKLEDRYIFLERKYEKQLLSNGDGANILRSSSILCQTLPNIGSANPAKPRATNVNTKLNQVNNTKSLMDALESSDESSPQSQIMFLQNEVIMLKDQITDLNMKIYKHQSTKDDFDFLVKENKKLKSDIKEMENLYEKQISDLNRKTVNMNAELEIANKQRMTQNKRQSVARRHQNVAPNVDSTEIIKYRAEIKFLQEKIEILNKEMNNLKSLYEKDIKFLKEQLKINELSTAKVKVSLATLSFERDCEIIKYKNHIKKLKQRFQGINMSEYSSNNTSSITGSFFKKLFK